MFRWLITYNQNSGPKLYLTVVIHLFLKQTNLSNIIIIMLKKLYYTELCYTKIYTYLTKYSHFWQQQVSFHTSIASFPFYSE